MKMVKVKVAELSGYRLDWAVAVIEDVLYYPNVEPLDKLAGYRPSSSWRYGGPLIVKHKVDFRNFPGGQYYCSVQGLHCAIGFGFADDLLTAAMRAIVASVHGDEVEVPEVMV